VLDSVLGEVNLENSSDEVEKVLHDLPSHPLSRKYLASLSVLVQVTKLSNCTVCDQSMLFCYYNDPPKQTNIGSRIKADTFASYNQSTDGTSQENPTSDQQKS
jgi:hypothetical protein